MVTGPPGGVAALRDRLMAAAELRPSQAQGEALGRLGQRQQQAAHLRHS